jgi:hypothetical protein
MKMFLVIALMFPLLSQSGQVYERVLVLLTASGFSKTSLTRRLRREFSKSH